MKYTFALVLTLLLFSCAPDDNGTVNHEINTNEENNASMHSDENKISSLIRSFENEFESIPLERKSILTELADFVAEKVAKGDTAQLIFICTHNSRRSHLSQIWAQTAGAHYGIDLLETFSGGTEATAFNPRAVKALKRDGFLILDGEGDNPVYEVQYAKDKQPLACFSKKYDDDYNPKENFGAIMTCSSADEACPIVFGAEARFSLPYEDPKASDNTPEEDSTYTARSHQIGTELTWAMSLAKEKLDQLR